MSASERKPGVSGTITTFYSYKGGTGRTMALANSACVLAERLLPGEKVLVVDWDLEAPGLHRYFPPRLRGGESNEDLGLDAGPGLIDLFIDLDGLLPQVPANSRAESDLVIEEAIAALDWAAYIGQTEHAGIHILRAGRNDDGGYGRRVNTFHWEGLFQRAPGIYRAFAERLASEYRWVLIDSRTGVTDISGICTSLLPERLVVVFTPNRQSLSGVRELVQAATIYRRSHDDLRPLLVLPLPSRIEASMEKARAHWRHGRPEDGIVGYQPMFQDLLAVCYDLPECELGPYFDAVQIQQTPDCAYGEVISVRGPSGDRFSLASSYRVFVDWLTAVTPPWEPLVLADRKSDSTCADPDVGRVPSPSVALETPCEEIARPTGAPVLKSPAVPDSAPDDHSLAPPLPPRPSGLPAMPALGADGHFVFLSHASDDRERVQSVARALRAMGFGVFDKFRGLSHGQRWDDQIAEALDRADAVVVFWSRSALASDSVRAEADEGLRRGVLLPVLLDESRPPIQFRGLQAADLRRDFDRELPSLLDDIARIALARPGDRTMLVPIGRVQKESYAAAGPEATAASPDPAPVVAEVSVGACLDTSASRGNRVRWWAFALPALLFVALGTVLFGRNPIPVSSTSVSDSQNVNSSNAPRTVTVPDLKGRVVGVAGEIAESLKLRLSIRGEQQEALTDGLVVAQSPAAGSSVMEGAVLVVDVAIQTTTVPRVGGMSLGDALVALRRANLGLGKVDSVEGSWAEPGIVVRQTPQAGERAVQGTVVSVGVAADAPPSPKAHRSRADVKGGSATGVK